MNLFELFVKIGVDDQASDKISNLSSKLGNGLQTAAKIGTTAVASAAAGITALTTAAVNNYAEYEQLVGGVETLFKQSADVVQRYAANAYKTAGLSANEYMETVTSFSASLLQSLGGDTVAAAEYANMAITDMSDNANKMGTSMEMIQNAYNGFAKQNFTMLDNLKLGYGGTKEEMQRLLEDAEKLSGIEYDISSYADIVDAIHIVQNEIGITGTTAKEASSTISGSVDSMKSAWTNLVTGIADENSNLDTLISNFVDSVEVAGDNIIPRVEQILVGISNSVIKLAPMIEEKLPGLIEAILPGLISAAGVLVTSLAKAIPAMLPPLVDAAMQVIDGIESGLSEKIPALSVIFNNLEVAVAAVVGAMAAYKAQLAISTLISAVTKALNGMTIAQWAAKAAQDALNIALNANPIGIVVTLLGGLSAALVTAYNTSENFRDKVNAAFNAIKSAVMPVINTVTNALGGLINAFSRAISAAKNFLGIEEKTVEAIGDNYDQIADKAEVNALIMSNITKNVEKDVSTFSKGVATVATTAGNTIASVIKSVSNTSTQVIGGITKTIETIDELLSDGTTQQRKIITTSAQEIVDGALKNVKTVETIAADGTSTIVTKMTDVEKVMLTTANAVKNAMDALGDNFSYTADETQSQANKMAVLEAAVENAQDDIQRLSYLLDQSVQETGAASEQTQFLANQLDRARDNLQSAQKALQDYQKQLDKSAAAQDKFRQSAKNAFSAFEGFGDSIRDVGELIGSDIVSGIGEIIDDMTSGVSTVLNFATSLATLTETLTTLKEAMNALKASEGIAGIVSSLGNMLGIGAAGATAGTAVAGTAAAGTAGAAAAGGTGILAVIGEVLSGPVGWALLAAGALGAIGLGISAATNSKKNGSSSAQGASNAVDYRDIQDAYWYGNERAFAGYDFRTDPYIYHQRTSAMNSYQQRMQAQIERLTDLVQEYLPQTANMKMVLDDGTLVGALTPSINSQLGQLEIFAERGNI